MRNRYTLLVCALASLAAPVWAVREWHDLYSEGEQLMRQEKYKDAIDAFTAATRLKPDSELNARPYGVLFIDYLPYYQMGICQLKLGDFNAAIRMFNIEELSRGAIKKSNRYLTDLRRQRTQAENAENARVARLAKTAIDKLEKEAADLAAAKRYDEALARLASALSAGPALDPATQRRLVEQRERLRAEQRGISDAAEKARLIDQALADARRLLDEGKPTEALVKLDLVLSRDPANRRASDGRQEATEKLLASKTREALEQAFQEGKRLFDAGRYEDSLRPLTDAAADPQNRAARDMLERARQTVERLRHQKSVSAQIDGLLAEAERLLSNKKFPDAQVRLEAVLGLDPRNARARQRLEFAETGTGESLFARFLPNRAPALTFFEPRSSTPEVTIDGPRLSLVGVASDDKGVATVEFFKAGRSVAAKRSAPDPGGASPNLEFEEVLSLEPGPNEIAVVATDSNGLTQRETFHVTRKLRFFETRAFLPAAFGSAVGIFGIGLLAQSWRRRRAVESRFNPYIAGAPVMDVDLFFGRQKLLTRILNVLHHNSLMITGERRIGKTTFMYHLRRALEADAASEYRFFPVFTDLQGVTESDFFHTMMSDVTEALKPDRSALRFRQEQDDYDGRDFAHDLQRVVEELKARTPKRVKLALLIDEVDVLNEFSERVNQRLRSIFMKTFSESLVAIMSGVGIRRSWKSEGSPWYNFFDEVELSSFARADAEALIRTPVEGIFRYEPAAVERIIEWSDLKPYVIQKFCIHAINRIIEERRTQVTLADVEAVREQVQFEGRAAETSGERPPVAVGVD